MSASRTSSSRLARAAGAERMALLRERDKLSRRREAAAAALAAVEEQLADVEERLELIDRLVPEAANVHPLPARGAGANGNGSGGDGLKGAAIRAAAVAVLLEQPEGATAPIHYREWFRALERAGHRVAGKDPLAVFLTQISRSPLVRRGPESGLYELDLEAPANLRGRLERLHARLAEQSTDRAERERIVTEIAVAERALEEAERALAPARGGDSAGDSGRRAAG